MNKDFHTILIKHIPDLTRLCNKLTSYHKEDSEDLKQTVLLKALQHPIEASENIKAWLFTITYNIHINNWRRNNHNPVSIQTVPERTNFPDYDTCMDHQTVLTVIDTIGVKGKMLFQYYEGYHYWELAEQYNIPLNTVKSRIGLARAKIIKTLELD